MKMKIRCSHVLIFSVGCLIILPHLISPLCGTNADFVKKENRNLTPFPNEFQYKKISGQLEEYYNDRIPFRYWLLPFSRDISKRLFPEHSNFAIVGRKGFLFYISPKSRGCPFRQFIGKYTYPISYYDKQKILEDFQKAQNHSEKNNAKFLAVIAPDKMQIYPDMLPEKRMFKQQGFLVEEIVRMAQKAKPPVNLLFLTPPLLEYRKKMACPLYFAQDTHWNYAGAYCALKVILDKLDAPWPASWPEPEKAVPDLSQNRLSQSDLLSRAPASVAAIQDPDCRISVPHVNFCELPDVFVTENPNAFDQREVLVFRDSFYIALFPYFSAYFRKVHYYRGEYKPGIVEKVKPQLVIFERISRVVPFFYRRKLR